MSGSTPRPTVPEKVQAQFAALSRINLIRGLLYIFAFYGIAFGLMIVLVGSFAGPTVLAAGILHVLAGIWSLVLGVVVFRGGRLVYGCLMATAVSIVIIGAFAVAAATRESFAIAAIHICIFLPLPVCLIALLASKSVRAWFLRDSR